MGTSGVVLIAPPTTSRTLTQSSSSSTTATSIAALAINSGTSFLSQTTPTAAATPTATSSVTALPPTQNSSEGSNLSKNQIVGISVAGVGGAAIVIGAMVFLFCLRRRKLSKRGSDTIPFQTDPEGPQQTLGSWGSSPTPPKVPPRFDISPPNMFSRRSIIPDNIGLAVSPDESNSVAHRTSKLLPEKPTFTLSMPGESLISNQPQTNRRLIPSTQSTMTQFEEDEPQQNIRNSRGVDGPERSNPTTIGAFQSAPINYTTGQFAPIPGQQNSGNDYPRYINENPNINRTVDTGPDLYVKPLRLSRQGLGSFSGPILKFQEPSQTGSLGVPNTYRPLTQASSLYSQQTPHSAGANFYNAPGTGQLSLNTSDVNAQAFNTRPTSYRQVGPYDRGSSSSSLTSFESEDATQGKRRSSYRASVGLRKSVVDLSPVAGSPSSGKSPVSYPKIPPPVRLTAQTIKMVPPPPQPNFGLVFSSRPNPNANIATKPWRAAEIAAQNERNQRREELRLSRATRPSPQLSKPGLLPAAQLKDRWNTQPGPGQILNHRIQNNNPKALFIPPSQQQSIPQQRPPQLQIQTQPQPQLQPHLRPWPQEQPLPQHQTPNMRPGAFIPRHSRSSSATSGNSTSSSLLAKRLGANKAAALQLIPKADPRDKTRPGWRVLKNDDIQAAKDPGWRPQLLQQVQGGGPKNGANYRSGDEGPETREILSSKNVRFDMEQDGGDITPPPVTPGWVPKLTPTRRGNELFLSVQ